MTGAPAGIVAVLVAMPDGVNGHEAVLEACIDIGSARGGQRLGSGEQLVIIFSSVVAAAAAAVEMQRAVEQRARPKVQPPRGLTLRAGLHVAETAGSTDRLVERAADLCAAAEPGQVLTSDLVAALAAGHEDLRFARVERGAELVWRESAAAVPPLPAPLASELEGPFVGREHELAELERTWDTVAGGEATLAMIVGEPGVGKTRLAAEFATSVANRRVPVLYGRADEAVSFPYQPFVEALRHYIAAQSHQDARALVEHAGAELAPLLGAVADRLAVTPAPNPGVDPATGRYRLFEAFAALLRRISTDGPVLVVLDDLHWADQGSLLLLRHLVRTLGTAPVLAAVTTRDTESGHEALRSTVAELWAEGRVRRVDLVGLDEAAVVSLVQDAVGPGSEEAGRTIHRLSDGNCFFARELARHVASGAEEGLPDSVVDVVARRTGRLSDTAGNVLRAAATIGLEFPIDAIAYVVDRSEDDVLDALEEATTGRLVFEVLGKHDRYAFAHALVQDAVNRDLSSTRRARLHRRVGEAIEALHGDDAAAVLPELARHFCAGADDETAAKAITYALAAARQAIDQFAFEEGVALASHAVAVLDSCGGMTPDERVELRSQLELALGQATYGAADLEGARVHFAAALDLARQRRDARTMAEAALGATADGVTAGEVDLAAVGLLQEALDGLSEDERALRVRLHSQLTRELLFNDSADSVTVAEQGVAIARQTDDPYLLSLALGGLHQALLGPGDPQTRLAIADEILTLAVASGDAGARRWAHAYRLIDLWQLGDVVAVEAALAAHAAAAAGERPPMFVWWGEALWAAFDLAHARYAAAAERIDRARSLGATAGGPNVHGTWVMQEWMLRWSQGRSAEQVPLLTGGRPDPGLSSPLGSVVNVLIEAAAGLTDAARSRLARVRDRLGNVHRDSLAASAAALGAMAAHQLSDTAAAEVVAAPLSTLRGRAVLVATGTVFLGAAETWEGHALATLGDLDGAVEAFELAVSANGAMGVETWMVHSSVELARVLAARGAPGDAERATVLARWAHGRARRAGMAAQATRAEAVLQPLP